MMAASREIQARRDAATKAFHELFQAGAVDGRRAQTVISILERYVAPLTPEAGTARSAEAEEGK